MTSLQSYPVVILAYVLCHGLTALLITPLQNQLFPDVTLFASLLYLPHGVRVLSAWLLGWRAFPPLCLGAAASEVLFTPAEFGSITDPVLIASIAIGASSALVAFEVFRLVGRPLYAGRERRVDWRALLLVGVLASVLNSVGQAFVFSDRILPDHMASIVATYAAGDLLGLVVTTLGLMMVFRWMWIARQLNGASR